MSFHDSGANTPPPPVTLEDVLKHSDKLMEELGSLVRAALRIESTLTGYPPAPSGEDPEGTRPLGLVPGLHDNLCEVSQRISVLNSALSRIEDRLMEPKVAQAMPVVFVAGPSPALAPALVERKYR